MRVFDGQRMAELRRARKLTGRQLAEIADCSNVTISRIENGHQQPTSSLAKRLADALAVPLEGLYVDSRRAAASDRLVTALGLGSIAAAKTDGAVEDAEIEKVVIDALRKMGPLHRAQAIGYILGLASSSSAFAAEAAAKLAESAEKARREPPASTEDAEQ